MEENKESKNNKSKFNASQLILLLINDMQKQAATYYREGSYSNWFFEWKNIKFQIIGKLTKNKGGEREKLKEKEEEIAKKLPSKKAIPLIEEYLTMIQDHINTIQMGLVSKGDETIFT